MPGPDVAHHRAGVAADLVVGLGHARASAARGSPGARGPASRARAGFADAGRVMDGVEDRRRGRDQRLLADALGAERADRRRVLDQDALDRRHVADGRDQIVVQVLALAGEELLHQREAEPLRGAALDLAFDQRRIDRAADVVRAGQPQHLHAAELDVDLDLGDMRARAEHRVGLALAVLVERRRRRIEGLARLRRRSRRR